MKLVVCPIPHCEFNKNPRLSDLWFLRNHVAKQHSFKERLGFALSVGISNYSDSRVQMDYLTSQGIVRS